jgi:hypothetical protein
MEYVTRSAYFNTQLAGSDFKATDYSIDPEYNRWWKGSLTQGWWFIRQICDIKIH